MVIRCASKAIIIKNEAVLLNRCKREDGCIYYDLPGGGQKPYESMEQTLLREVKEETGYEIRVERFVGLAEGNNKRKIITVLVWAKALWTTVGGKNFPPFLFEGGRGRVRISMTFASKLASPSRCSLCLHET